MLCYIISFKEFSKELLKLNEKNNKSSKCEYSNFFKGNFDKWQQNSIFKNVIIVIF